MNTTRTTLALESLDDRRVPATLSLTTAGSQGFLPGTGGALAHFSQLSPGAVTDVTETFLRLQEGSFLGSLLTPEEGYNTSARPLQFDATGSQSVTRSLLLADVPLVTFGGNQYREFLLTVNQPQILATIDLTELRIFLSGNGALSGYNTSTDRLAGLTAAFDLDASGNDTVRINDNLNRTGSPDVRVLIPESAFNGSDPDSTYVYLYSKFDAFVGTTFVSGAESWAVRDIPTVPPPPPPPTTGSLSGRVYNDANENGQYDEGEGIQGLIIILSGFDANDNNLYPDGDPTVVTGADGSYSFVDLLAGTYTIAVNAFDANDILDPVEEGIATTDEATFAGDPTGNGFGNIQLSLGEVGTAFDVLYTSVEGT